MPRLEREKDIHFWLGRKEYKRLSNGRCGLSQLLDVIHNLESNINKDNRVFFKEQLKLLNEVAEEIIKNRED